MESKQSFDENTIVQCFTHIHDPNSNTVIRKQADTFLMDCQKQLVPLMKTLVLIFQNNNNNYNAHIRLLALLYLSNVIKRNWNNKRLTKTQPELSQIKKQISILLINYLQRGQKMFMNCLFDLIQFIAKADYPHAFPQLNAYCLHLISNIQINENNVGLFKGVRDIFIELADRKGFANAKNFEQGPRKILNNIGSISQAMRQQLCKNQDINPSVAKLSKYCDQIMICIIRLAPYFYLDDQNFMMIIKHILQKLQLLLTAHNSQINKNKTLLQKDIKSIVYQLGCLQAVNPCMLAPVLSDYISTLFYVISKPQIFVKPATVRYGLLSMRKVIKQFTYYADESVFNKSVTSQPKSNNYLQLRKIAHQAYLQFMTEDTVQEILNFLLTNIMNIKSKEDQGFVIGFDDNVGSCTGYEKSTEKDLSVHVCGTLLAQSLIQRFTEKMLTLLHSLLNTCIQNNWENVNTPTLINFLSILSILPKSCRRNQMSYLSQYPIIGVLQFAHGSSSLGIRQKFPALISGWLDIFTNQQIAHLLQALLNYVQEGAQNSKMQILLYSCYSLNKIVTLRSAAVDSSYILHKIFPVAIKVFDQTDNPQILWPLINLISTLLSKCEFDTNIIVNSVQSNSLNALISNESEMLVEALCEMFKSFLCIIPRNKPAVAVFKLIYHFLNKHLAKTQASYHEKCVTLWYYSIRQFSQVNQCNQQYYELFENHFRKCMFSMKPILIYILQQYMLLGLIQSMLQKFVEIVIEFYREGQFIQNSQLNISNIQNAQNCNKQDGINLKIAALSFQITLITKYKIEQVNSQQMLYAIIKDFCGAVKDQNATNNIKMISNTLQNSLLSIVNRYIMLYPDYLFQFLQSKMDITPPNFYVYYFKNMSYLTSRTALRINALALSSLLTKVQTHFKNVDKKQLSYCLFSMLTNLIPELEQHMKYMNGQQGLNAGKIQNSPTIRFSQSILSQRKQQVRKQGSYDQIDLRSYFLKQFKVCLDGLGINLQQISQMLNQNEQGKDWGNRLFTICN